MKTLLGYFALEILSLLTSIVMSFLTWDKLAVHPIDSGIMGDGFGFLVILVVGLPLWVIAAYLTPLIAGAYLQGYSRRLARVAISFFAPLLVALITTATMTWFLNKS